jgi:hypothetical protein
MADNDGQSNGNSQGSGSILDQVKATLAKEARESLKGKLKQKLQKRQEHERALSQIDAEIAADIEAFEKGL